MIRDLRKRRYLNDGQPALMAALPPMTIGLMLFTLVLAGVPWGELVIGGRSGLRLGHLTAMYAIPGALAVAIAGIAAWVVLSGIPRWGYAWVYSLLVMVSMALVVMGDDRPALISPVADAVIALALLGALAVVALIAARRSAADALAAGMGFAAAFVLVNFSAVAVPPFRRVDLALLALPAGWALRGGAQARLVAAVLTTLLAAGLMSLYATTVTGEWAKTGSLFATRVVQIAVVGPVVPPVLAWALERWGRGAGA